MVDANRSFYSQRNSQMEIESCTTEIKWGGGEVEMWLLLNSRSSARKASTFPNKRNLS